MNEFSYSIRKSGLPQGLTAMRRNVAKALAAGLIFTCVWPTGHGFAQEPTSRKTTRLGFHAPRSGSLIVEVTDEARLREVRLLSFLDAKSLRLEAALKQLLDRNRDGRIDEQEWQDRWSALLAADLDQDELIVPLEISPSLVSDTTAGPQGASKTAFDLDTAEGLEAFRSQPVGMDLSATQLHPDVRVAVVREALRRVTVAARQPDVQVREFDRGRQFQITRDDLVIDVWPTLTLSPATATTPETPPGAGDPIAIQVRPGRRGAFEWFDTNRDGSLGRREILAAELPPEFTRADRKTADTVSFTLQIGPAESLRRTSVPLVAEEPPTATGVAPAWFTAMDRNRDGEVSLDEFLGGDSLFRSADFDQDGHLSAEEAGQLVPLDRPR